MLLVRVNRLTESSDIKVFIIHLLIIIIILISRQIKWLMLFDTRFKLKRSLKCHTNPLRLFININLNIEIVIRTFMSAENKCCHEKITKTRGQIHDEKQKPIAKKIILSRINLNLG